jgi:hypothetical protein
MMRRGNPVHQRRRVLAGEGGWTRLWSDTAQGTRATARVAPSSKSAHNSCLPSAPTAPAASSGAAPSSTGPQRRHSRQPSSRCRGAWRPSPRSSRRSPGEAGQLPWTSRASAVNPLHAHHVLLARLSPYSVVQEAHAELQGRVDANRRAAVDQIEATGGRRALESHLKAQKASWKFVGQKEAFLEREYLL